MNRGWTEMAGWGQRSKGGCFKPTGTVCGHEEPCERAREGFVIQTGPRTSLEGNADRRSKWVTPNSHTLVPYLTSGCPAKHSSHHRAADLMR